MTCIVGLAHDGAVTIGGDSAATEGWTQRLRADAKVFQRGPFLMGVCGSYRVGQLLRYALDVPDCPPTVDPHAYLCTTFVDAVRKCLADGGIKKTENGVEEGGDWLLGYRGRLYRCAVDFQIGETFDGFDAVGSGGQLALGALAALADVEPEKRVWRALEVAEMLDAGVRGPFVVHTLADRGPNPMVPEKRPRGTAPSRA